MRKLHLEMRAAAGLKPSQSLLQQRPYAREKSAAEVSTVEIEKSRQKFDSVHSSTLT
jgi:hypothetical protein